MLFPLAKRFIQFKFFKFFIAKDYQVRFLFSSKYLVLLGEPKDKNAVLHELNVSTREVNELLSKML